MFVTKWDKTLSQRAWLGSFSARLWAVGLGLRAGSRFGVPDFRFSTGPSSMSEAAGQTEPPQTIGL